MVGLLGGCVGVIVAMTRAKRQLCVIGDSGTVGKGSEFLRRWMEWLEGHAEVRFAGDLDL